ncbi:MAG: FG-GAP repeat domain-containing protein [Segetibacter sp.]
MKGELQAQIPQLKKKLLRFDQYAGKSMEEIFTKDQLKDALVLSVEQAQTSAFINEGTGNFTLMPLPVMAQIAPVYGVLVKDINNDGIKDILLAGNFFGLKPQTGRFDASYGTTLFGDEKHNFHYAGQSISGLLVKGEARDIATVESAAGGEYIVVSVNNEKLCLFMKKSKQQVK